MNSSLRSAILVERLEALVSESIDTYNNKRPHLDLSFKTPDFMHEKTWVDYSTGFT